MLAHVDDCDIIADSESLVDQIKCVCKQIWDITDAKPDFMLGVKRDLIRDKDGTILEYSLNMIAYVEGMAEAFKDKLPKDAHKIKEPAEKGLFITKADLVSDDECKAVLDAGYQVAVGMLMWAVRQCYPGGKIVVSMLCRVMARPNWMAFNSAMHLIAWIFNTRTTGIRFSKCKKCQFDWDGGRFKQSRSK